MSAFAYFYRILFIISCCLLFAAKLNAAVVLKMGVHNFPPDIVVNPDGSCGGPGLVLSQTMFEAAGMQVEPVCITPARMYMLLDNGDIDFSINIKSTLKLSRQHVAVEPPYSELQLVLYSHLKQTSTTNDIAAIRAFDYQGQRMLLQQVGYHFIDLPDSVSASQFFVHQRSQHLLTYDGPFRAYLNTQPPELLKDFKRKPITSIDTFYILSARSPHLAAMQQAITLFAQQHHCVYLAHCLAQP
jgi:hypothetical protein